MEKQVITEEQALYVEMKSRDDFEEIRLVENNRVGKPVKGIIFQSKSLGKKIVVVPLYFKLMKGRTVLGYKEWKAETVVVDFNTPSTFKFAIIAETQVKDINESL